MKILWKNHEVPESSTKKLPKKQFLPEEYRPSANNASSWKVPIFLWIILWYLANVKLICQRLVINGFIYSLLLP